MSAITSDTLVVGSAILDPATNPIDNPFIESGYASIAFMFTSTALVFIMAPGVGFLYSGMVRKKHSLSILMICMLCVAIVTLQWFIWGFSLAFAETGSSFLGTLAHGGLTGVGMQPLANTAPGIPSVMFCLYQLQFATLTAALVFGSVPERIRLLPSALFVFIWTTIVYDPVAYWTWGYRGWVRNISCVGTISTTPCGIGSYDFAGGGPVHVASGFSGLAFCLIVGKRSTVHKIPKYLKPHNMGYVFLGTALLWFGWFGFNGGSALSASPRAIMAALVTTIATCSSAVTWCVVDYIRYRRISGLGFCSGAVSGLVCITPAAGFVAPWAAFIMGILGGLSTNFGCEIKNHLGFDDSLDAFGLHGIGGVVGNILTGIFAQSWLGTLDGTEILGGWCSGHWVQIGYQIAGTVAIAAWAFCVTYILLFVLNKIPGFHFRLNNDDEQVGSDQTEMGECAYLFDETDVDGPILKVANENESSSGTNTFSHAKDREEASVSLQI